MADAQELLKFRELVEQSGLPEAEVKRHVRTFSEFFSTARQGRTKFYAAGSVDLLKQIHEPINPIGFGSRPIRLKSKIPIFL